MYQSCCNIVVANDKLEAVQWRLGNGQFRNIMVALARIIRWLSIFAVTLLVLLQLFDTNLHVAALLCTASIHLFAEVINFSCKKIKYIPYLYNKKVPVVGHFFFFETSHINMFSRLKLGNKIFLRSSSSSGRSFNNLPNEKINQNSTLRLQLIKISIQSLSTASHLCKKWLNGGRRCIILEHSIGNPFSDWSTNIDIL